MTQNPLTVAARPAYQPVIASERWKQYKHDNFTGAGAYFRSLDLLLSARPGGTPTPGPAQLAVSHSASARVSAETRCRVRLRTAWRRLWDMTPAIFRVTALARMRACGCAARNDRDDPQSERPRGFRYLAVCRHVGGALVMSTWRPHHLNAAADSARLTGIGVSTSILTNIAREFAPELRQKLRRHLNRDPSRCCDSRASPRRTARLRLRRE